MPAASPSPSTRERILTEARRLFHEQGFAETAIADIRHAAGVSSSSLYHQFRTKDDLLLAVLESYRAGLEQGMIAPAFASTADPIERIFALLQRHRDQVEAWECTKGCPLGNLALEVGAAHPEAQGLLRACFDRWIAAVRTCLDAVADRLPERTDPDHLASFVFTVMEGAVMQCVTQRTIAPFDAALAELRNYFDCLLARPGAVKRR